MRKISFAAWLNSKAIKVNEAKLEILNGPATQEGSLLHLRAIALEAIQLLEEALDAYKEEVARTYVPLTGLMDVNKLPIFISNMGLISRAETLEEIAKLKPKIVTTEVTMDANSRAVVPIGINKLTLTSVVLELPDGREITIIYTKFFDTLEPDTHIMECYDRYPMDLPNAKLQITYLEIMR